MARILDFVDGFESGTEPESIAFSADFVVVASGNLESDNAQDAFEELQGDIDTINASLGQAGGIATLDGGGTIPTSQLPALSIISVNAVADITERDGLAVEEGDVAIVADAGSGVSKTYIWDDNSSTWLELLADGSLAAHAATTGGTHGLTGDFVGTTDTQTLTNKDYDGGTASDSRRITVPKDTKANLLALTRKQGTIVYASDEDKIYYDNGSTLVEVGSGSGSGGINYIDNPNAETDTTGYATYADAAGTLPVDGTGGTATTTWTRSTSSPLRGTASFLLTKDAANRQGEGASYDFSIDDADKAKVLAISFDYEVSSGTYATDDVYIYIYDVTNGVVIQPNGYKLQNVGIESKHIATFQTDSVSTSYRLIFHVASTSASAYTLKFDNIIVGPQTVQYGAPDVYLGAITTTGSWVSNTTYTANYWRRGDWLVGRVKVAVSGAPTSAALSITLPNGLNVDTSKLVYNDANAAQVGNVVIRDSGTANYLGNARQLSTTPTIINIVYFDDAAGGVIETGNVTQAAPMTWAANDAATINFEVPILGWSSSVQMSNDTDTRVVACRVGGDPAAATSGNPVIFPTVAYDTHASYNATTGRYTAPAPGFYRVHGYMASASAVCDLQVYVNAVAVIYVGTLDSNGECTYTGTVQVNAGDIIDIRPNGTGVDGTVRSTIHFERLSGPSAIAASEKIAAIYNSNTALAIGSTVTDLKYEDKLYDTHGAYNTSTGVFTSPRSGFYKVNAKYLTASATWVAGNYVRILIYINGVFYSIAQQRTIGATTDISVEITESVYLNAGDTLQIKGSNSQSAAFNGSSEYNRFSIISEGI